MKIEIFAFRVHDGSGNSIIAPRMATREFIAKARGEIIGEARVVDEKLVNGEGQQIFGPMSEEARMLRDLYDRGGKGSITGNKDRSMMRQLEVLRLVTHSVPSLNSVDYEITPLGTLAVEQFLR